MKKKLTRLLFTCGLLLMPLLSGAQIVNGTFDVNNPGYGFYCGAPYGWTSSAMTGWGDMQWENQWNTGGDTWWVDITGCGWGNDHWIEQTVITVPGMMYTLSFDLGCWNGQYYTTAGANVLINGSPIGHYEHTDFSGSQLAWKTFTYCFTAYESQTTIRFEGDGAASPGTPTWCTPISGYVGVIGLDNVSLKKADGQIFRTSGCVPQVLTHNSSGGQAYWFLNGQFAGTGDTFNATVPGTYKLIYQTPCGVVEDEVTLEDCKLACEMNPDFTMESIIYDEPEIYCAGKYVIFTGFSTTNVPLQYNWDFGDGPQGWTNSPVNYHIFPAPGTYNVCLTVWLKPDKYIPFCHPYTICKTITVVDCTEKKLTDGGGTGEQPWPPSDPKSMLLEYPSLQLFPNPATDQVTINGLIAEDTQVRLALYNISGKLVYEYTPEEGVTEVTLSVKDLEAGVYLLKVNGTSYYKELKIVKQ